MMYIICIQPLIEDCKNCNQDELFGRNYYSNSDYDIDYSDSDSDPNPNYDNNHIVVNMEEIENNSIDIQKKLNNFVTNDNISNENCAICIDNFYENCIKIKLQCGHYYHYDCIQPWIEKNNNCPLCRKIVIEI